MTTPATQTERNITSDAPDSTPLYMIRSGFDAREFQRWMGIRNFTDADQSMHSLLTEMFGDAQPKPFRLIMPKNKVMGSLMGYTSVDAETLKTVGRSVAGPAQERVLRLDTIESKTMPDSWAPGTKLGFEIRTCPIYRNGKHAGKEPCDRYFVQVKKGQRCPHCIPGKETDVYRLASIRYPRGEMPYSRDEVYVKWLARRFEVKGCANVDINATRVNSFQILNAIRRPGTRPHILPEVVFRGELEITDSKKFRNVLSGGIGRHKAYGFGMILLRPVVRMSR